MYPSYKFIIIIIFFHHFPINGKHFSIKVSVNTWPLATADNHYKQRKLVTFCVDKTKKPVMSLHVANKAFLSTWKVTQEMIFPGRLLRHFQKYGPYGLSMARPPLPAPSFSLLLWSTGSGSNVKERANIYWGQTINQFSQILGNHEWKLGKCFPFHFNCDFFFGTNQANINS